MANLGEALSNQALSISNGGTGQATQQAALDAITAASGASNGQVLTSDGTNASWGDPGVYNIDGGTSSASFTAIGASPIDGGTSSTVF